MNDPLKFDPDQVRVRTAAAQAAFDLERNEKRAEAERIVAAIIGYNRDNR